MQIISRFQSDSSRFMRDLVRSRHVVSELTRKDFTSRYMGSYLGLVWAFIHPVVTIGILWFVFTYGLKAGPVRNTPFIIWLMAGMVPWFFFSEALGSATGSIIENGALVKKVVFRVSLLPSVKLLSALLIHLIFVSLLLVIVTVQGRLPGWCVLQLFYYMFAMVVLLTGLSWFTCALTVFVRDLGQAITVLLQFVLWMTPIMWNIQMVPEKYQTLLKFNPIFYIIRGYRDSLIDGVWVWQRGWLTLYFWLVAGVCLLLGAFVFRRLRPHFADVL